MIDIFSTSLTFQVSLPLLLLVLLSVVLLSFVLAMLFKGIEEKIGTLLGLTEKNKVLTFLGLSMGGILIALQALIVSGQTKAMHDAVSKTEQGQRQERMKNAIEHLGDERDSVRLGGAYQLFHLAKRHEDLRQTALDILCAHIRWTTGEYKYRRRYRSRPSEEIQSLLDLLFMQGHDVFEGLYVDLRGSWLNGAMLMEAQLQGAMLWQAQLRGAMLMGAQLQGAYMWQTQLQGAVLAGVLSRGAAQLQGAYMWQTQLQGAVLVGVQLQGVSNQFRLEFSPFAKTIRDRINQKSNLDDVIFAGELHEGDLASVVEKFPAERVEELRKRLEPHIGKTVSYQRPEDISHGTYTEEEAERWIAEYKGHVCSPHRGRNEAGLRNQKLGQQLKFVCPGRGDPPDKADSSAWFGLLKGQNNNL